MHHADHLLPFDLERRAVVDGSGRCQPQPSHCRKAFLSNEVAGGKKRDGGLFTVPRNDSDLCAALLKIKDGVCRVSLAKKGLLRLQFNDSSAKAGVGKKDSGGKCRVVRIAHQWATSLQAVRLAWTAHAQQAATLDMAEERIVAD
jgi:hypothetical protein